LPKQPIKVNIAYCAECGYDVQAIDLAATLLRECAEDLIGVELVPWHEGSFEVTVGGTLVHSMYREGGFPEPAQMVAAVRAHAGAE
jgi:selenoprotein W-related protein